MWSGFIAAFASLFGLFAFFKYVILIEIRIDANTYKTLYDLTKNKRKIIISEEFMTENRYPISYSAICLLENAPWFFINHQERMLQAGWQGKDYVTFLICFRWDYKKLKDYLQIKLKELQLETLGVPVEVMLPYYTDKLGSIKQKFPEPVLDPSIWKDFEQEVAEVAAKKRLKTSALLYGPPGNGKTSFVKFLATKYRLPVMVFTLSPEWSNHELLLLFSQIPPKCLVLLEDFDNYYNGRNCVIGGNKKENYTKFTFDTILNGLDGIYNTYENVVFIMTVNDISKVDNALKNRPSRFKFVRQFDNPNLQIRSKLLPNDWADVTNGFNLDEIFRLKEYCSAGLNFEQAKNKLNKNENCQEEFEKKFKENYDEKIKNLIC